MKDYKRYQSLPKEEKERSWSNKKIKQYSVQKKLYEMRKIALL